jgi:hypothetical protein
MKRASAAIPALVAACVLAAACEAPGTRGEPAREGSSAPPRVVVRSPAFTGADELAAYLAKLRGLSESGLVAEATRQRRALTKDASDAQRVRTAIALAVSPQGEDAEVLGLAEPVAKREGGDANAKAVASLLVLFAGERRRLREAAAAARASAREEKRAAETQKQRAEALQERAAQLQQKLDALTELEKSLSDRPPPAQ